MTMTTRRGVAAFCLASASFILLAATASAQKMPQTKTETIGHEATVTTEQLHGTVAYVEGNDLVVRMSNGGIREFKVPESRRFMVDGKELSVHELKPGTTLTATVTTTNTPVTERTTTVGTGKVFFVSGNNVILTLPNNENRMYKVQDSYKFNVNGSPASVHDLRKGMVVSAQKIVEVPRTEIATNTTVTGHGPPEPKPTQVASAAPAPRAAEPARPAPSPEPAAAAPAPTPEQPARSELPATGSPLPLIGLVGLLCTGAALGLRKLRRS